MKVLAILVVSAVALSYIPVMPMDGCPEAHHMGNTTLDCGYSFHCPILTGLNLLDFAPLPYTGEPVSASSLIKVDGWIFSIFRPPELAPRYC